MPPRSDNALLFLLLLMLFIVALIAAIFFIGWLLRRLDALLVKANQRLRSFLYYAFWGESP